MSFEQSALGLTFYCDDCDAERLFPNEPSVDCPAGTDYVACKLALEDKEHWISLKRLGRQWDDFCPECASHAKRAHEQYLRKEQQREQNKQHNERSAPRREHREREEGE